MTVFITGATGFIGAHVLARLSGDPSIKVRVLTRKKQSLGTAFVTVGDLANEKDVEAFLDGSGVLINLAYVAGDIGENLKIARNLTKRAREVGVSRIIHCSTAVVVGSAIDPVVTEKTPPLPSNEYESAKLDVEREFFEGVGENTDLFVVRPTAVFGRGGLNALKLTNDRRRNSVLKNYLLDCVYGKRSLNLVSVNYVADAIYHLVVTNFSRGMNPIRETILLATDVSENEYSTVAKIVDETFDIARMPGPRPSLSVFLPIVLKLAGRDIVDPRRRYRSINGEVWRLPAARNFLDEFREFLAGVVR